MNLKVRIYGTIAQLYLGQRYVGSIMFDNHICNKEGLSYGEVREHTFVLHGRPVAKIDAISIP